MTPQPIWDNDHPIPYCSCKCQCYRRNEGGEWCEAYQDGDLDQTLPEMCWDCAICLPALALLAQRKA